MMESNNQGDALLPEKVEMDRSAAFSSSAFQRIESLSCSRRLGAISKRAKSTRSQAESQSRARDAPRVSNDPEVSRDWLTYIPQGLARLRVLFIGHNPSDGSWEAVAPYAHGSNSFWKLLAASGLAPREECVPATFARLARTRGIAFGDLFVVPGSDASKVISPVNAKPIRENVVERMQQHMKMPPRALALVSKTVAQKFLGEKKLTFGLQGTAQDLKFPEWMDGDCQIWVLPTTSGRAGMRWEERLAPFKEFAFATNNWSWAANRDEAIKDTIPENEE